MLDDLSPWCRECIVGLGSAAAERLRQYRRDYGREYQRARRARIGPSRVRMRVQLPHGVLLLTWSATRGELRITGRWKLLEDAMQLLTGPFEVALSDVRECGRGGGKGSRRHKTFVSTGPVGREAWERGVLILHEQGGA